MNKRKNESGQSILIIALVVLVLLALIALVVDVGNAYAHRRMVQNAVDAAALAGARKLAFRGSISTEPLVKVTEMDILLAVKAFAEKNGLEWPAVRPYFIFEDGETKEINKGGSYAEVPENVIGVKVEGDLPFDTYFAHLLGFPTMQATADSAAYQLWGPCSGDCIFPATVSTSLFVDEPGGTPVFGKSYVLWEQTLKMPGNFGWIYWVDEDGTMRGKPPQGPEVTTLEPNLMDNCRSGAWYSGDKVHGDVGVNFQPVLDILEDYVTSGITVTIPLYDMVEMEGNNGLFQISDFGVFRLTCAHASRAHYAELQEGACEEAILNPEFDLDQNSKFLIGVFDRGYEPAGFEDGCMDTGVSTVSFRPPKSLWMPEWHEDDDD